MRPPLTALLLCVLFIAAASSDAQVRAVSKAEYLAYMEAAASDAWGTLEADRVKWRETIDVNYVFGYNPPGSEVYLAALYANLFESTGKRQYLDRAKKLLLDFGTFRSAYPATYAAGRAEYGGVIPAIPNIFYFGKYCHAYAILQKHATLSAAERAIIDENIAGSADFVVRFQEWGAMNRAMLRAEGLLYAAKVVPHHPHRDHWVTMGNAIAGDNDGEWEIEDATSYNGVWLYSLLPYLSDIRGDERAYRMPVMQYYFEYFLQLISPAGFVPDFGDSQWASGWDRLIPFFEKGAAVNKDPRLRWAAACAFRRFVDPMPAKRSVFMALIFSDALRWADLSLPATAPTNGSRQVLEDIVGKKVVFRNGWTTNSTYMLLNYRDEGDGGWLFRENLRNSIPVEEEKMHHGHSDENSIVLLMRNNSILLHDGGYRDYMPSGPYGAFRADYFHNRVAVRDGKIALGQKEGEHRYATVNQAAVPGQTMLDFFRNSGAYRDIRTKKIDFLALRDVDYSRTRITDDALGYEGDRIVFYVKALDCFVVVDAIRYTRQTYLTMANLWHTRQILARGTGWYDTAYDSLQTLDVRGSDRLLVLFPEREHLTEGVETQLRYWQPEQAIYQLTGRHGYRNDIQRFITVLMPHGATEKPEDLAARVRMVPTDDPDKSVCVSLTKGDTTYILGAKLDLEAELVHSWRRPMYSYESGRATYGDYTTDAFTLCAVETPTAARYAVIGAVRVEHRGKVLYEQLPVTSSLRFDGGPDITGTSKMRMWEGEFRK